MMEDLLTFWLLFGKLNTTVHSSDVKGIARTEAFFKSKIDQVSYLGVLVSKSLMCDTSASQICLKWRRDICIFIQNNTHCTLSVHASPGKLTSDLAAAHDNLYQPTELAFGQVHHTASHVLQVDTNTWTCWPSHHLQKIYISPLNKTE